MEIYLGTGCKMSEEYKDLTCDMCGNPLNLVVGSGDLACLNDHKIWEQSEETFKQYLKSWDKEKDTA